MIWWKTSSLNCDMSRQTITQVISTARIQRLIFTRSWQTGFTMACPLQKSRRAAASSARATALQQRSMLNIVALATIVIDGSLSSLDANPSNPTGNPVGDPMTVTPAVTPAKWLAYGHVTNTVTVLGSYKEHTHERASCGDKMHHVTASINTDRGKGTIGGSVNSSEDDVKESLVVDHNKRLETSIS
jgi:hypothetical protein